MNQYDLDKQRQFAQFLATHKGAGVSCVMLLIFTQQTYNVKQLVMLTGYSRDSVGKAVDKLHFLGFVERKGHKIWLNRSFAEQLPLPHFLIETGKVTEKTSFSDPYIDHSIDRSIIDHIDNPTIHTISEEPEMTEKPAFCDSSVDNIPPQPQNEVSNFLADLGITDPKRSYLASLPHMTIDYVRAYAHHFFDVQPGDKKLPLFIWRIEKKYRAPKDCKCNKCEFDRRQNGGGYKQDIPEHLRHIIKR